MPEAIPEGRNKPELLEKTKEGNKEGKIMVAIRRNGSSVHIIASGDISIVTDTEGAKSIRDQLNEMFPVEAKEEPCAAEIARTRKGASK
jgi:hypothetical protein